MRAVENGTVKSMYGAGDPIDILIEFDGRYEITNDGEPVGGEYVIIGKAKQNIDVLAVINDDVCVFEITLGVIKKYEKSVETVTDEDGCEGTLSTMEVEYLSPKDQFFNIHLLTITDAEPQF